MTLIDLDKISRQERLRKIINDVKSGDSFSAFDLAVLFNVSLNVIYRDVKILRNEKLIPDSWKFKKRVSLEETPEITGTTFTGEMHE